ncbi:histidine kinase [Rhodobacteraceae bacterium M385]|nr:histidine kinase [Rhodobacteraceae bacterium M385]
MTSGRIIVVVIVLSTILFGVGLWYTNTRAYYAPLEEVTLTVQAEDGTLVPLAISDAQGIDAATSPLRYRACFTLDDTGPLADATPYADPTPLFPPAWFDCFDASAIGEALESGAAQAYLGQFDFARGVDRVVAIFPDGRGFAWTQLNGTLE